MKRDKSVAEKQQNTENQTIKSVDIKKKTKKQKNIISCKPLFFFGGKILMSLYLSY